MLGKFPTLQSMAGHAIVAEHSYFLMQHGHHLWGEVLSLAVEEYNNSNVQPAISKAVKAAFHDHSGDMHSFCEAIIEIIIEHRMSNKLLMEPEAQ
ncbi:hypothetical protein BKA82DRAFT_4364655 [Pisolithus tinctorius]|nr:hypothetical protein BKA82DRAFT_4364655 [Pisolithus tinctorius]